MAGEGALAKQETVGLAATLSGRGTKPRVSHLPVDGRRRALWLWLRRALALAGEADREPFDAFRAGLLRHIGLEEKILLPAAREARHRKTLVDLLGEEITEVGVNQA